MKYFFTLILIFFATLQVTQAGVMSVTADEKREIERVKEIGKLYKFKRYQEIEQLLVKLSDKASDDIRVLLISHELAWLNLRYLFNHEKSRIYLDKSRQLFGRLRSSVSWLSHTPIVIYPR